jgi:hypothetical protein
MHGRSSNELQEALNEFENMKLHDNLVKLREPMIEVFRSCLVWQSDIEISLKSFDIDVNNNYGKLIDL